jgi:tRNA A37 methylthiotransferase MiaB
MSHSPRDILQKTNITQNLSHDTVPGLALQHWYKDTPQPDKKIKIFFYHANDILFMESALFLGIAALYLKTYIDHNRPEIKDKLVWMLPEQRLLSDEELVDLCVKENVDLLCTSHYSWNNEALNNQLKRVRSKLQKHTLVLAGGASIDANVNVEFFSKHPYIDFAFYGAGEVAFADLIEHLLQRKKLIAFNTSNIVWFDPIQNRRVKAEYKYVPESPISPYTSNRVFLAAMVKTVKNFLPDRGVLYLPYELTRGCPYTCTFCDWNSGLSTKVSRRKNTYQEEIDLFQELKIQYIYLADANVGQYSEDIEMIEYLGSKNIKEGADFKIDGNFSKLRKQNNLKIYHAIARANLADPFTGLIMSVQDPNEQVLKNIERPDVGWDDHVKFIEELVDWYPTQRIRMQLIQGLPGQTKNSWRDSLAKAGQQPIELQPFVSELLPASPAASDPEYQSRWQFEYSNAVRQNGYGKNFQVVFPKSCVSFSQKDFAEMSVLTMLYTALMTMRKIDPTFKRHFDLEQTVDTLMAEDEVRSLTDSLYENWVINDQFYYPTWIGVNQFTACCFQAQFCWQKIEFLNLLSKINYKNHFALNKFYHAIKQPGHIFLE